MTRVATMLGVSLASLLAVGCATHQTAKLEAAAVLGEAPSPAADTVANVTGRTAMAWGDRWTATNLFEQAVEGRDTVVNRFNLATGYQTTGRTQAAAALYRELVRDGQFTRALASRGVHDRTTPVRRFNIADESAIRLRAIQRGQVRAPVIPANSILAAADVGSAVSATAGGGPVRGRISDAEARRLDEMAERARAGG